MNASPSSRFRIIQKLGDGGMGTVYLAVQLGEGGFEKKVALKRLKPDLSSDQESVELFLREARLAAQLNHPNIVQVFDGGLEEGNLYLVLEYVDGGDLEQVIRSFRTRGAQVSPAAVALIGAQMCEALCSIFDLRDEKNVQVVQAHRDISPSNVLLSRNGVAKLSDFGVVRLRESKTAVGKVRGKWEYFPPELIKGTHDARGDLFALGITLYKLASLRHPFEAATAPAHFERACRDEPEPLTRLPTALWGIIARALAKDPRQRYQSAEEMGADLDAFLSSCNERMSPRYLSRELFATGPTLPATARPAPQESAATLMAGAEELRAQLSGSASESRTQQLTSMDEVKQFEDLFGPVPERTPSRSRVSVAEVVDAAAGKAPTQPVTQQKLLAIYEELKAEYRKHKNQPPPVTLEQLGRMIENRREQLEQRHPGCGISVSVTIQNGKIVVKVRPVKAA